jgi:alpha-D-ribose 1-methylphosphonate 5-phosphate C-P lyase
MLTVAALARAQAPPEPYAYLDEGSKREVRRALLKAAAMPGRQVPFASREMPVARGWGSGGLQVTLSIVGPHDIIKVTDQGNDASVNALAMRSLIASTARCSQTTRTADATIIQSRHRLPETPLRSDQLLVLQAGQPDPLWRLVPDAAAAALLHAEHDYTLAWLDCYDAELRRAEAAGGTGHPVLVNEQVLMSPSSIPPYDIPRLDDLPHPVLFGAGGLSRVMVLPPRSEVRPLSFADRPFRVPESRQPCARCHSAVSHRVESPLRAGTWWCSDTDACAQRALA